MARQQAYEAAKAAGQELARPRVLLQTVDSAQGSESDVIILSAVRCNALRDAGFLRSRNRLNVACSRARHSLIIACCYHTLEKEELFKRVFLQDGLPVGAIRGSPAPASSTKSYLEDDFI